VDSLRTAQRNELPGTRGDLAPAVSGSGLERRVGIVLPPVPASLGAARHFVATTLEAWDSEDHDEVVALLTSEIVSNAVLHAVGDIGLDVAMIRPGLLRVDARDGSPEVAVARRDNRGGVGGHGLQIVDSLARRWGVERHADHKVVWFEAAVRPRCCAPRLS
jgi:hypothetical protein